MAQPIISSNSMTSLQNEVGDGRFTGDLELALRAKGQRLGHGSVGFGHWSQLSH